MLFGKGKKLMMKLEGGDHGRMEKKATQ